MDKIDSCFDISQLQFLPIVATITAYFGENDHAMEALVARTHACTHGDTWRKLEMQHACECDMQPAEAINLHSCMIYV